MLRSLFKGNLTFSNTVLTSTHLVNLVVDTSAQLAQQGLTCNLDILVPSICDPQISSRLNRKHFASEALQIITTHHPQQESVTSS